MTVLTVEESFEAVRPYEGRTTRVEVGAVDAADLARFGMAIGGGVREDGTRTPVLDVPPLYLTAVQGWGAGPPEAELRPDGAAREQLVGVPVEGLRLMGAGQDVEFIGELRPGEEVVQDVTVQQVTLKEGRSGSFLIITLFRVFRTGDRELLRCTENFIGR